MGRKTKIRIIWKERKKKERNNEKKRKTEKGNKYKKIRIIQKE